MQRDDLEAGHVEDAAAYPPSTLAGIGARFREARAGDEAAKREVYIEVYPRLCEMLHRQLKCDVSTAEDLAQEALVRALNPNVPAGNLEAAPFGWLMTVARRCLKRVRGGPMLPLREDEARAPVAGLPDQAEASVFFFLAFRQAFECLDANEKQALGLIWKPADTAAQERPSNRSRKRTGHEIAQIMGKSDSSVAKYLHSARNKIAKHFHDHFPQKYEEHREYFRKFFEDRDD